MAPSTVNWTDPVAVPDPGAVTATVAVKDTDWPNVEGVSEELTAVVVPAAFTAWPPLSVPVLEVKLPSPL